jgi:hypothetical protein
VTPSTGSKVRSRLVNTTARLQAACALKLPDTLAPLALVHPTPIFLSWLMQGARNQVYGYAKSPKAFDRVVLAVNRLLDCIERSPNKDSLLGKHRVRLQQVEGMLFEFFLGGVATLTDDQPEYTRKQLEQGFKTIERLHGICGGSPLAEVSRKLAVKSLVKPQEATLPLGLKLPWHLLRAGLLFALNIPNLSQPLSRVLGSLSGIVDRLERESSTPIKNSTGAPTDSALGKYYLN